MKFLCIKCNPTVFQPINVSPFVNEDRLSATYMARYLIFNKKLQVIYTSETVTHRYSSCSAAAEALLIIYMYTAICRQVRDNLCVKISSRKQIRFFSILLIIGTLIIREFTIFINAWYAQSYEPCSKRCFNFASIDLYRFLTLNEKLFLLFHLSNNICFMYL